MQQSTDDSNNSNNKIRHFEFLAQWVLHLEQQQLSQRNPVTTQTLHACIRAYAIYITVASSSSSSSHHHNNKLHRSNQDTWKRFSSPRVCDRDTASQSSINWCFTSNSLAFFSRAVGTNRFCFCGELLQAQCGCVTLRSITYKKACGETLRCGGTVASTSIHAHCQNLPVLKFC